MNLRTFIERPVLSAVISITIVVVGIIGLFSLPVEQYPDIAPPTIMVSTTYYGASAETLQKSVIAPLEEAINGVEDMTYMTSTATNAGTVSITVYFKQGTDPDMAAVNVQNRVSRATGQLPAEVTQVGVTTSKRQTSILQMFSLSSPDDSYDENFLSNYISINIKPQILRISGVGDLMIMGGEYSMRVWMKPDVMAQYKLIPSDITGVLAEQNIESATGSFGENSNETYQYTMKYKGRLITPEEFGDIVIRSTDNGEVLKLKDIAEVQLGQDSYAYHGGMDGHPGVSCMVFQTAGSNATEVNQNIDELLEEVRKDLPKGVELTQIMSSNDFLFASIHEVVKTLIEAIILVILVVYVFLQDFRSTLIPMIAVPVALVGAFFFLWVFGFSINLLTLSALLLAIAIVVDDAIVVVEAVHAKLDQGYKSALTASIDAMNEISGAIISITLVMSAVFVPVSFIGGTSGYFYREFGVTMAVSIVISAVNALTLSPALCAVLLKPHDGEHGEKKLSLIDRFHAGFNYQFDKITNKYKKGVKWVIGHGIIAGSLVAVSIVGLVALMGTTKTGLVPDEDTGTIFACISTAPGTTQERTAQVVQQVDKMLANNPAVATRNAIMGYSFIGGTGSNQGTIIVKLKPFEDRPGGFFHRIKEACTGGGIEALFVNPMEYSSVLGMIYKQTATIKDAQVLAFAPPMISGFSVQNGITMTMQDKTGGDLNRFYTNVKAFLKELNARPEIQTAQTQYNPNYPQYMVDVDVAKTKQAGISPSSVLAVMQGYLGGLYASNFNAYGKLYRVMIQAGPENRMHPDDLNKIYVRCADGTMSPVSEFVNLKKIYGPSNITRFNLFTSMDVSVTPNSGYSTGDGMKAIAEVAKQTLPEGYGYEYSGLTRSEAESSNSTGLIFALCIVFVYLILSAQYESYILPLSVVLSIPFGLAGAFVFTNLFGHSNDIYMQISLIMLIGLLAKNAILIVQFALERRRTGMAIKYSAILGAGARLRPILMTSLAMIIGLLPLMFASGVGKNGNQTLGAAAVGGMLIGTICQIFVVPALFAVFEWLQEKLTPLKFEDEFNAEAVSELEQYANAAHRRKGIEKK